MTADVVAAALGDRFSDAASEVATRIRSVLVGVRSQNGGGSGTVWRPDGLIVTNHHVVPGDRAEVQLQNERIVVGRVVAREPEHDLVALQLDETGLQPATVGDSGNVRPGELVFAAGNPWG